MTEYKGHLTLNSQNFPHLLIWDIIGRSIKIEQSMFKLDILNYKNYIKIWNFLYRLQDSTTTVLSFNFREPGFPLL